MLAGFAVGQFALQVGDGFGLSNAFLQLYSQLLLHASLLIVSVSRGGPLLLDRVLDELGQLQGLLPAVFHDLLEP